MSTMCTHRFEACNSDEVHFKLDTGACGNLFPFKKYLQMFPRKFVKDLSSTVDQNIQLLTTLSSVRYCEMSCDTFQSYPSLFILCSFKQMLSYSRFARSYATQSAFLHL